MIMRRCNAFLLLFSKVRAESEKRKKEKKKKGKRSELQQVQNLFLLMPSSIQRNS
jgi:hypothetical protein